MSTPTASLPHTSRGYHVHNPNIDATKDGFAHVLALETRQLPPVGRRDVLVAIHAVSLNWRDIAILTNTYIRPFDSAKNDGRILCSDGAGIVLAVGDEVTRFQEGDHVAATFFPSWIDGLLQPEAMVVARGAESEGLLREFAVLGEDDLVKIPAFMSLEEASTLPCAGVTAWNALFGHGGDRGIGRRLMARESVLVQGTGGVSLFAAQFARAKGADVIATTSSEEKVAKIEDLVGVPKQKVVNYKTDQEWGTAVKNLTRDQKGVDIVVEITGSSDSLKQSYTALKPEGQASVIGTRGATKAHGAEKNLSGGIADILHYVASTRRIAVGSREMFEEMNAFIEQHRIRPVVDPRIFEFEEARDAMMYMYQGKQLGNIVIRIKH